MDIKPQPNRAKQIEILRRMTPGERLKQAFALSDFGRRLFFSGLRTRFPNASDDEIRRIALERMKACHNRNY
jgi:hypothetical protein